MLKGCVCLCNCEVMMSLFLIFVHFFWLQNTVSWVLIMGVWWIQSLIGVEELMERNGGVVRMWCLTRSTVKDTCIEVEIVQESLWKHLKLTLIWQQSHLASHTQTLISIQNTHHKRNFPTHSRPNLILNLHLHYTHAHKHLGPFLQDHISSFKILCQIAMLACQVRQMSSHKPKTKLKPVIIIQSICLYPHHQQ